MKIYFKPYMIVCEVNGIQLLNNGSPGVNDGSGVGNEHTDGDVTYSKRTSFVFDDEDDTL